jgi:hypothetical protein
MTRPDAILAGIAREHFLPTLQTHCSDSTDFHDLAVWQIDAALKAAFAAGAKFAGENAQAQRTSRHLSDPATSTTPLVVAKGMALVPDKMYLRLYHGRTNPDQEMDDWGFAGPTFGPLACYVHTYCSTFRIHGEGNSIEIWLDRHDDMIRWDGCFYGDMEIFIAGDRDKA